MKKKQEKPEFNLSEGFLSDVNENETVIDNSFFEEVDRQMEEMEIERQRWLEFLNSIDELK
jgi:hypothetical protein